MSAEAIKAWLKSWPGVKKGKGMGIAKDGKKGNGKGKDTSGKGKGKTNAAELIVLEKKVSALRARYQMVSGMIQT